MLKTLRVLRNWWSPFLVLKTLTQRGCPDFSIKNVKSRKAVLDSFWVLKALSGQASLSFHMMHKFPGTTFSRFPLIFFDCNNILISIKKDVEHIPLMELLSGLLSYYTNKRSYTHNARSNRPEQFRKYRWKSPYVSNDCL